MPKTPPTEYFISVNRAGLSSLWDSDAARRRGAPNERWVDLPLTQNQRDMIAPPEPSLSMGIAYQSTKEGVHIWSVLVDKVDENPTEVVNSLILGTYPDLAQARDAVSRIRGIQITTADDKE